MRVYNINTWEDVYENFISKEDWYWDGNKSDMGLEYFGQSWTLLPESDAMWRIYSKPTDCLTAIKVRTTVGKLICAETLPFSRVYPVVYMSEEEINSWLAENTPMNTKVLGCLLSEAMYIKREPFNHEKEVRLIIHNPENKEYSELSIESPDDFFEEYVIDPRLDKTEVECITQLLITVGASPQKIWQSSLYSFSPVRLDVDSKYPSIFQCKGMRIIL